MRLSAPPLLRGATSSVVSSGTAATQTVAGYTFRNYGSHCDDYPVTYMTVAAALGMTTADVDALMDKLDGTMAEFHAAS